MDDFNITILPNMGPFSCGLPQHETNPINLMSHPESGFHLVILFCNVKVNPHPEKFRIW